MPTATAPVDRVDIAASPLFETGDGGASQAITITRHKPSGAVVVGRLHVSPAGHGPVDRKRATAERYRVTTAEDDPLVINGQAWLVDWSMDTYDLHGGRRSPLRIDHMNARTWKAGEHRWQPSTPAAGSAAILRATQTAIEAALAPDGVLAPVYGAAPRVARSNAIRSARYMRDAAIHALEVAEADLAAVIAADAATYGRDGAA